MSHHSDLSELGRTLLYTCSTFTSVCFWFLRAAALSLVEVKVGNIRCVGGSSRAAFLRLLLQLSLPDLGQPRLEEGFTFLLKLLTLLTLSVRLRKTQSYIQLDIWLVHVPFNNENHYIHNTKSVLR